MSSTSRLLMATTLCAALTAPLLSGCVVGAAAALTGATLAASDRRTVGTQVEDRTIQLKASNNISERLGSLVHVNATVYNRQLLLTGEAPDEATKRSIDAAVAGIPNLKGVVNDVQIAGQSSLTSRSNDALITGKVKASIVDAQDLNANAFKVTTEAGVVYLMGLVTAREADRGARIAAGVPGVAKVVKVMEVITEEELARLTVTPTGNSTQEGVGPRAQP